jgi:nucleoside-diphosphate-sugar epimerase
MIDVLASIINLLEKKDYPVHSENIRRQNEIMDTVADIRLANQLLQWQPAVSIETGLQRMLQQFRSRHHS